MRLTLLAASLLVLSSCGGSSTAANPDLAWMGSWKAVSVDGQAAPTTFVWATSTWQLNSQTFYLASGSTGRIGLWSSDINQVGGSLTVAGGASISWNVAGNTLTTIVTGARAGRVLDVMDFAIQADGSLVRIEDSNRYVYRKN